LFFWRPASSGRFPPGSWPHPDSRVPAPGCPSHADPGNVEALRSLLRFGCPLSSPFQPRRRPAPVRLPPPIWLAERWLFQQGREMAQAPRRNSPLTLKSAVLPLGGDGNPSADPRPAGGRIQAGGPAAAARCRAAHPAHLFFIRGWRTAAGWCSPEKTFEAGRRVSKRGSGRSFTCVADLLGRSHPAVQVAARPP